MQSLKIIFQKQQMYNKSEFEKNIVISKMSH